MLTGLHLRNFKAFAETQHIPIRPLTLIFGANSAGKSSIIHSLLVAHHASETGNLDVRQSRISGHSVDLGGFREYVHRHDTKRHVELAFEVRPDQTIAARFSANANPWRFKFTIGLPEAGGNDVLLPTLLAYEMVSGATTFARLERGAKGHLYLAGSQPDFLKQVSRRIRKAADLQTQLKETESALHETPGELSNLAGLAELENICLKIPYRTDRFIPSPITTKSDRLMWDRDRSQYGEEDLPPQGLSREFSSEAFPDIWFARDVWFALDKFFDDTNADLRSIFADFSYLGPLRCYPSRDFGGAQDQDPNWLSGGGKAWENLRTDEALRQNVNQALTRLGISYQLRNRPLVRQGSDKVVHTELIFVDQSETELSQRDLGIGVSQAIPVITNALGSKKRVIAIEQPEIHLHPALQAELGDVFIESALGERKNTFILETHSEHLILRILRRMRETHQQRLPKGLQPVHPKDVAVLYVEKDGPRSIVREMPVNELGQLVKAWPGGFFEEGLRELLS